MLQPRQAPRELGEARGRQGPVPAAQAQRHAARRSPLRGRVLLILRERRRRLRILAILVAAHLYFSRF